MNPETIHAISLCDIAIGLCAGLCVACITYVLGHESGYARGMRRASQIIARETARIENHHKHI